MKIEDLIKKLEEKAKENPTLDVAVEDIYIDILDDKSMLILVTKKNSKPKGGYFCEKVKFLLNEYDKEFMNSDNTICFKLDVLMKNFGDENILFPSFLEKQRNCLQTLNLKSKDLVYSCRLRGGDIYGSKLLCFQREKRDGKSIYLKGISLDL